MSSTNFHEEDYRAAIIDNAVRREILEDWGRGCMRIKFKKDHPGITEHTVEVIEEYYLLWFSKVMPNTVAWKIRTKTHNYDAWKDGKLDMPLEEVLELTDEYDNNITHYLTSDDGLSDGDADDEDEMEDGDGEVDSGKENQEEKVEPETVTE
ncbi:hypothetical protein VF21_05305 [Pseudogymnoascus sp. 05NY08]|nr:hypothetical protein VF21_05305 [Pseudogymnoascus sp. 05NY08]